MLGGVSTPRTRPVSSARRRSRDQPWSPGCQGLERARDLLETLELWSSSAAARRLVGRTAGDSPLPSRQGPLEHASHDLRSVEVCLRQGASETAGRNLPWPPPGNRPPPPSCESETPPRHRAGTGSRPCAGRSPACHWPGYLRGGPHIGSGSRPEDAADIVFPQQRLKTCLDEVQIGGQGALESLTNEMQSVRLQPLRRGRRFAQATDPGPGRAGGRRRSYRRAGSTASATTWMTRSPNFRSARCTRSNFSQREMPGGNVQMTRVS